MTCTECGQRTTVTETRVRKDGSLRRRRKCPDCGYRFTTTESIWINKKELKNDDDHLRTTAP